MKRPEGPRTEGRALWGWVVVVGIGVAIVLWATLQYFLVRDVPREWSYGSLPETPSASIYSTVTPAGQKKVPLQIEPLPEAKPLKKQEGQR